ncbi:MAG: methyltransferase domain-containing protein [Gammaproteobacteria bacterium]
MDSDSVSTPAKARSPVKKVLKGLFNSLRSISPTVFFLLRYQLARRQARRAYASLGEDKQWRDFLDDANSPGKKCLQIGVRDHAGGKFGPNWVSVDKFDESDLIDYRDDVQSLSFGNDTFDAVVCDAVLEHVPRPWVAIAELNRVLKPGGAIWVSVPMSYPYHEGPKDYWRVTPDALRIWMADFVEVCCGIHYWSRSSLVCATHFYGRKRND